VNKESNKGSDLFGMDSNTMSEVFNSPIMENLLNNPELLKSMIMSNPNFKKIAEENPEIGKALTDPETLKKNDGNIT